MLPLMDESVSSPECATIPDQKITMGVGNGWAPYEDILKKRFVLDRIHADCFPSAQDIATLATIAYKAKQTVPAELALPIYLRDKVTD